MFRLAFAAVALLASSFSAGAQEPAPPEKPDAETIAAADRLNRLGLALLKNASNAKRGNMVISPWPTYRSVALAMLGAAGVTRDEIATALGAEDPVADHARLLRAIDPQIARWNRMVAHKRPGETVDQVQWGSLSAVWLDQRLSLHPGYGASTRQMHGTLIRAIDLSLQSLGILAAFDREKADFSRMTAEKVHLENVYDAAEFRIDEAGLSGAAATAVIVSVFGGDTSALPADSVFRVDRPFLFALQQLDTGLCIFIGQVTDPR